MTPFEVSWVDFKCCTKHLFKYLFLQFLLCFHVYIPEDMLMCSCFYSFFIFLHCTLYTKILRKERGKEPNKSKDARTGVLLISPVCFSLDPLKFSFLSFIFRLRDPLVFDNAATLQGKPLLIHSFQLGREWWMVGSNSNQSGQGTWWCIEGNEEKQQLCGRDPFKNILRTCQTNRQKKNELPWEVFDH